MSTNPVAVAVEDLRLVVEAGTTIKTSAIAYINGVPGLIQAAYDKGVADGVDPAALQVLSDLKGTIETENQAFIDALPVNTPDGARKR